MENLWKLVKKDLKRTYVTAKYSLRIAGYTFHTQLLPSKRKSGYSMKDLRHDIIYLCKIHFNKIILT